MRSWFSEYRFERKKFDEHFSALCREETRISVGIITHARARFLERTLEAIIPQIKSFTEVVVVVDGYDDDTLRILDLYRHSSLRVFVHEENLGRPFARNRIVRESWGDYILWIDDDDIPSPDIISTYMSVIESNPDIDVIYCNLDVRDYRTGRFLRTISAEDVSAFKGRLMQNLIMGRGITFGGSLMRRSLIYHAGGFDERFNIAQDSDLWFRLADKAFFHKVPYSLYTYNEHPGSVSVINRKKRDFSYVSFSIRNLLARTPLEEIFPEFNWDYTSASLAKALLHISSGMFNLGDLYHAYRYIDCIPEEQQNIETVSLRVKSALVTGRILHAQSIVASAYKKFPSPLKKKVLDLRSLVIKVAGLETEIMETLSNNPEQVKHLLKKQYKLLGPNLFFFITMAERCEKSGSITRAREFMETAYRYNPERNDIFEWLVRNSGDRNDTSRFESLRIRMRGEKPDSPLYFLARLCPEGHIFS